MTGLTALQLTVYVPLLDDEGTVNKGVGGVIVTDVVVLADQEPQSPRLLQAATE